jgi:hypothetical protein
VKCCVNSPRCNRTKVASALECVNNCDTTARTHGQSNFCWTLSGGDACDAANRTQIQRCSDGWMTIMVGREMHCMGVVLWEYIRCV